MIEKLVDGIIALFFVGVLLGILGGVTVGVAVCYAVAKLLFS